MTLCSQTVPAVLLFVVGNGVVSIILLRLLQQLATVFCEAYETLFQQTSRSSLWSALHASLYKICQHIGCDASPALLHTMPLTPWLLMPILCANNTCDCCS